jgi:hypothetical protein
LPVVKALTRRCFIRPSYEILDTTTMVPTAVGELTSMNARSVKKPKFANLEKGNQSSRGVVAIMNGEVRRLTVRNFGTITSKVWLQWFDRTGAVVAQNTLDLAPGQTFLDLTPAARIEARPVVKIDAPKSIIGSASSVFNEVTKKERLSLSGDMDW